MQKIAATAGPAPVTMHVSARNSGFQKNGRSTISSRLPNGCASSPNCRHSTKNAAVMMLGRSSTSSAPISTIKKPRTSCATTSSVVARGAADRGTR